MSQAQQEYDVIIVGSGAAGGMCAYLLAVAGVKVLLLEAGRDYDPTTETPMFTVDGGWEVPGEPYTSAEGTDFRWWRARMLGGRTNHWGRISLRMGEYDFKPYSRDGLGFDWPMTYEDLAPYYDKTERLIGVYGSNEGLENTPASSPGVLPFRSYRPTWPSSPRFRTMRPFRGSSIRTTRWPSECSASPCVPERRASGRLLAAGAVLSRPTSSPPRS